MSEKVYKDNGGPAFPGEKDIRFGQTNDFNEGMTLRDYFAAKAIGGMLSGVGNYGFRYSWDEYATSSYELADAMLAARNVWNRIRALSWVFW